MKLIDNLYVYEWTNPFENNCNSFFIGGDAGVLIDPGLSVFFPDLMIRLEEDGITQGDIRYIVNTHSHPDHFEASELFNEEKEVSVCILREEKEFYDATGESMYGMFGLKAPAIVIDRILEEGIVELGGESFEIVHTPGHSPGSLSLYWPAQKALFPGDVIFFQSVGRTDFPGGDTQRLKDSIRRLSQFDVEYLLPGHMDIIRGSDAVQRNFRLIIDHVFSYL